MLLLKYAYEENFRQLNVWQQTRGRPASLITQHAIPHLYHAPPPIFEAESNDLSFHCKNNAIPYSWHGFYNNLNVYHGIKDGFRKSDVLKNQSNEMMNDDIWL